MRIWMPGEADDLPDHLQEYRGPHAGEYYQSLGIAELFKGPYDTYERFLLFEADPTAFLNYGNIYLCIKGERREDNRELILVKRKEDAAQVVRALSAVQENLLRRG